MPADIPAKLRPLADALTREAERRDAPAPVATAPAALPADATPAPATEAYRGADVLNMIGAVIDYYGQAFIVTSHGKSQLLGFPDSLATGHVTPSAITFIRMATNKERSTHRLPVAHDATPPATSEAVAMREACAKECDKTAAWAQSEIDSLYPAGTPIDAAFRVLVGKRNTATVLSARLRALPLPASPATSPLEEDRVDAATMRETCAAAIDKLRDTAHTPGDDDNNEEWWDGYDGACEDAAQVVRTLPLPPPTDSVARALALFLAATKAFYAARHRYEEWREKDGPEDPENLNRDVVRADGRAIDAYAALLAAEAAERAQSKGTTQ